MTVPWLAVATVALAWGAAAFAVFVTLPRILRTKREMDATLIEMRAVDAHLMSMLAADAAEAEVVLRAARRRDPRLDEWVRETQRLRRYEPGDDSHLGSGEVGGWTLRADDLDGPLGPGRDDNPGDQ